MKEYIIDVSNIRLILNNKKEAITKEEKIAVIAHENGFSGKLLIETLNDFPVSYQDMDEVERGYFMVGYAFGQKDHKQLDLDKYIEGNLTTH